VGDAGGLAQTACTIGLWSEVDIQHEKSTFSMKIVILSVATDLLLLGLETALTATESG
jgi:hypothetical protein